MKFGKRLETEALANYRAYYIQYKELKKAVKVFAGQERNQATVQEVTHWTSSFLRLGPNPEVPPEAKLNEILDAELERVSKFAALQEDALRSQLARLEEETARGSVSASALRARVDELGEQIVHLKSFAGLNFTGFRKILKKYDKWSKSAVLRWFMGKVMRAALMNVDYDALLQKLNSIAMSCAGAPASSESAETVSQVLLVLPKDTMWVKVQLAKHLRITSSKPRGWVSCYFDTPDFTVYSGAVQEEPTAVPVQLCYKDGEAASLSYALPGKALPVEVELTRSQVTQLMAGGTPPAVPSEAQADALRAFRAAVRGGLAPVANAAFRRSSFCEDGSDLSCVLDEDVKLGPLDDLASRPSGGEFLPYNLLQVVHTGTPKWLSRICDSADVLQASGFSLALHTVARCRLRSSPLPKPQWYRSVMDSKALADDEDETKPEEDEEEDAKRQVEESPGPSLTRSPTERQPQRVSNAGARLLHEFGQEPAAVDEASAPAADDDSLATPLIAGARGAARVRARPGFIGRLFWQGADGGEAGAGELPVRRAIVTVQPKTLYSNERTFLEWIHFATLFAALGIGLMHASPRQGSVPIGRCLVLFAVAMVIWSLNTFHWRADALDRKSVVRYHDPIGPPALVLGMLAALAAASLHALEVI